MIEYSGIEAARQRISPHVRLKPTIPLISSNAHLFLIFGRLQARMFAVTGSFKTRGAINALLARTDRNIRRGSSLPRVGTTGLPSHKQLIRQRDPPLLFFPAGSSPSVRLSMLTMLLATYFPYRSAKCQQRGRGGEKR